MCGRRACARCTCARCTCARCPRQRRAVGQRVVARYIVGHGAARWIAGRAGGGQRARCRACGDGTRAALPGERGARGGTGVDRRHATADRGAVRRAASARRSAARPCGRAPRARRAVGREPAGASDGDGAPGEPAAAGGDLAGVAHRRAQPIGGRLRDVAHGYAGGASRHPLDVRTGRLRCGCGGRDDLRRHGGDGHRAAGGALARDAARVGAGSGRGSAGGALRRARALRRDARGGGARPGRRTGAAGCVARFPHGCRSARAHAVGARSGGPWRDGGGGDGGLHEHGKL